MQARPQTGLALVTVMLIVAIAVGLASTIITRQGYALRQVENLIDRANTQQRAIDLANLVIVKLQRDLRITQVDHPSEPWAKEEKPITQDGSRLAWHLSDAQGRFNLNNLLNDDRPDTTQIRIFRALLRSHGYPVNLADAVIDWMDANRITRPNGAEDSAYSSRVVANRGFTSIYQLLLVRGFTPKMVHTLAPDLTALPQRTSINLNTATPGVWAALYPDIEPGRLKAVIDDVAQTPLINTADANLRVIAKLGAINAPIDVKSYFFLANLHVQSRRAVARHRILVQRFSAAKAPVVLRVERIPIALASTDKNT